MQLEITSPGNALLTTVKAAEELGVSTRTLEVWRQNGTGPDFVKVGHRVMYRRDAIEAYLNARTFRTIAEHKAACDR